MSPAMMTHTDRNAVSGHSHTGPRLAAGCLLRPAGLLPVVGLLPPLPGGAACGPSLGSGVWLWLIVGPFRLLRLEASAFRLLGFFLPPCPSGDIGLWFW